MLVAATTLFLFLSPAAASTGWRLIAISFAGFAILAAGWGRLRSDFARLPALPLLAFAAWAAVSAASWFWSEAPHYSAREIKTEIGYGLVTFAVFVVAGMRVGRWHLWRNTLLVATALTFAIDIALEHLPWRLTRHSMDGGPGPWSTHLVMMMPLLLMISWPRPWGDARRLAWSVAAVALVTIAAWRTENRIVWAAIALQLALVFALSHERALRPLDTAALRRLLFAAAVAVVLALGAAIVERSEKIFGEGSVQASLERDLRPKLWSAAWEKILEAPWLGHGFGREIVATRFLALTPGDPAYPPMLHSHNMFMDIALQTGFIGLCAFLMVIGTLGRSYASWLSDMRLAPLGIVGISLLAGFLVKNLTDDFLHRHNSLVFWALNGMLLGLAARGRRTA